MRCIRSAGSRRRSDNSGRDGSGSDGRDTACRQKRFDCFDHSARFEDDAEVDHFLVLRHWLRLRRDWHCDDLVQLRPIEDRPVEQVDICLLLDLGFKGGESANGDVDVGGRMTKPRLRPVGNAGPMRA